MIKKHIFLILATILLLLVSINSTNAQSGTSTTDRIRTGTTLPTNCTPSGINIFYKTNDSPPTLYTCTATNTWSAINGGAGSGDVVGPASSTDNAVARFDSTTGKLLQNSVVLIGDTGNITGLGTLNTHTIPAGTSTFAIRSDNLSVFASTTSAQFAGIISNETGTGVVVFNDTPTLIAPTLGVASVTSINGLTISTTTGTITLTNGKTLSISNTLTFTGTDTSSIAFGAGGTVAYIGASNSWSDGVKQTFNPNDTNAGINVGSNNAEPSSPINGDIFYDGDDNQLKSYINGAWVALGAAGSGANAALSNLASVAINTDLLPASTQGLGNASFPFLASFVGNTTQYESVTQSAGVITHTAAGSATNIGFNFASKGSGSFAFGTKFIVDSGGNVTMQANSTLALGTAGIIMGVQNNSFIGGSSGGTQRIGIGFFNLLNSATLDTTNTANTNPLILGHKLSSGTASAGMGTGILFRIDSTTTTDQEAALISAIWTTATHASRTSDLLFHTVNNAGATAEVGRFTGPGGFNLTKTITAGGTTGAQTIDKSTGSVNFAATDTSLVVTNSLVTTSSVINCTVATNDTTFKSAQCVAAAGSFTIFANAAATAETRVNFRVTN